MKLCGVVVLYNPQKENFVGIKSYLPLLDCLIVVDNSEQPNANATEFENTDKVVYLPLGENKGLGYALNIGCKEAISRNYLYVITMDQDSVLIHDGFDQYAESILRYEDAALISPQYMIDRKKDIVLRDEIEALI